MARGLHGTGASWHGGFMTQGASWHGGLHGTGEVVAMEPGKFAVLL